MATIADDPVEAMGDPAPRMWWVVPAVALVILALIGLVFGGEGQKVEYGTSYDASAEGSRAAYLLLEELRYPVERSRLPVGSDIRWVLFPTKTDAKDAQSFDDWVRRGGIALLALNDNELAERIGLPVSIMDARPRTIRIPWSNRTTGTTHRGESHTAEAPDVSFLRAGSTTVTGPAGGREWGRIGNETLVTIHNHGHGQIWLLRRPDVFANHNLREEDNAVLACRLADAMLAERPGGRVAFDEYCHGLRDRPSVIDLLFRPPVLGVTLQTLVLVAIILWHSGKRFGPMEPPPSPARRSKAEFLDALAELLARNGDRAAAYRTVRDAVRRRIERELGLSAETPLDDFVQEAVRRRGIAAQPLQQLLAAESPPGGRSAAAFLHAVAQLDSIAHEFFRPRTRAR
jgi:hypothetical protein